MSIQTITELTSVVSMIVAASVVGWVTLRSKLPEATIKIQSETLQAMQVQNATLKAQVETQGKSLTELLARVGILETIPLRRMDESLQKIAEVIEGLEVLGRNNQVLIKEMLHKGE